jgi:hypothetical protein
MPQQQAFGSPSPLWERGQGVRAGRRWIGLFESYYGNTYPPGDTRLA